ncbi:NupC/NupG family nucleoside CNT transporter, partial [Clostridium perfringens]
MKYLIAILGLLVVFGLAFLVSNDKRHIRYRPLAVMIGLQLILGFILLHTNVGEYLV